MFMFTKRAKIVGKKVFLDLMNPSLVTQKYYNWLNDPEVYKFLEARRVSLIDIKRYVEEKDTKQDCLFWGIFWLENGEHIGTVKLEPINLEQGMATLAIMIGERGYWGRGVGIETVNLVTDYAFNVLGLDEINLGVVADHESAIKLYKKCGYKVYKTEPQTLNYDGVVYDHVFMKKTK